MSEQKYKVGQHVIVLGLIVNGERRDIGAHVKQYMTRGNQIGKVEVVVNSTYIIVDAARLMDYEHFWNLKNSEQKDKK